MQSKWKCGAMRTKVIVTTRKEGLHKWPQAPDNRIYLRERHRHLFHIRVESLVEHPDRQTEFHTLLDRVNEAWLDKPALKTQSCEQLCSELWNQLADDFNISAIEVWEDGECGARVEFDT